MSDGRQGRMFRQGDGLSVHQVVQDAPHRFRMSPPGNVLGVLLRRRARVLVVGHRPGRVGQTLGDYRLSAAPINVHFRLLEPALSNRIFMSDISGLGAADGIHSLGRHAIAAWHHPQRAPGDASPGASDRAI